jgi:small ligand-binding sensory domain FIST
VTAAGSGLSVSGAVEDAALEASLAALSAAGADGTDLAFVFVSGDAWTQAPAVLHAVRRVTGARAVVGCSGAGVLTERGEVEGRAAVAVLAVRDERMVATPFLFKAPEALGEDAGRAVARATADTLLQEGSLIVLPDPRGLDATALLGAVNHAIGPVPVVGAVAAGMPVMEMANTAAAQAALAGLALSGLEMSVGVAQGCMPIGEPYVITAAEDNVVATIGSRPALRILREAIDTLPGAQERIQRVGVFAGLAMDPAKSPLERGDFLVRNVVGIDTSSGAIALAEPVRVGQTIQFQIRDAETARADLTATLDALATRLDGRRPRFGCYFNCAGRGRGLFGTPDHDVRLIRARFGRFPLVGVFGNGEFGPIGTRNFLHTYTGVLALFVDPA